MSGEVASTQWSRILAARDGTDGVVAVDRHRDGRRFALSQILEVRAWIEREAGIVIVLDRALPREQDIGQIIVERRLRVVAISVRTSEEAVHRVSIFRGNDIHSNGGQGIDLDDDGVTVNDDGDGDSGANTLQNSPVVTSAVTDGVGSITITGAINSTASTTFEIDLFANSTLDASGDGEGD